VIGVPTAELAPEFGRRGYHPREKRPVQVNPLSTDRG